MDLLFTLPVMVVLLLLKGFFSGSEIALVNADKIKLRHRAKQGHAGSRLALKMLQSSDVLLSTTLVGTNVSTVVLTTLGTRLNDRRRLEQAVYAYRDALGVFRLAGAVKYAVLAERNLEHAQGLLEESRRAAE